MSTVADSRTKPGRRKTPFWQRALPWVAGILVLAGVAAAIQVWVIHPKKTAEVFTKAPVKDVSKVEKNVPLDPAVKTLARAFITTAVARKDLRRAYQLVGPEITQGQSLKQWMKGNIAVVPYPADAIDVAPFRIDFSHPRDALLEVMLLPKAKAKIRPTDFYLGVRKVGTGATAHWIVISWVPHVSPMVPSGSTGNG
jgi:hypothetical protein